MLSRVILFYTLCDPVAALVDVLALHNCVNYDVTW